ncbi:GNAT family N-acetyltransferase [Nonomuraea sp. NPDC048881]|uniref:GNAT family N-acetyltransferase n=1 Tax=Nonomuraea sp. NPDC048881 TaxID=3155030 RepID=UPI0033C149B6
MYHAICDYNPEHESAWLRCRVLSFLTTAYFDDVATSKPAIPGPGFELIAEDSGTLAGILDVAFDGEMATVETIAVHPDRQRRGIGRALLDQARARARKLGARTLDAWTRDDPGTLRWYRTNGFTEGEHYLHIYANYYTDPGEPDRAIGERRPGLRPMAIFLHAGLPDEHAIRAQFARVHVCRRFVSEL